MYFKKYNHNYCICFYLPGILGEAKPEHNPRDVSIDIKDGPGENFIHNILVS